MLKTFKGNSEKEAYISHKKIGGLLAHPLEPDYHGIKALARVKGEFLPCCIGKILYNLFFQYIICYVYIYPLGLCLWKDT